MYVENPTPASSTSPRNRLFISDNLRENLQKRLDALHVGPTANTAGLPDEVHVYHSLVPLEPVEPGANEHRKFFAGWSSTVYKAINRRDGNAYVLRRIEGNHSRGLHLRLRIAAKPS